MTSKEFVLRVLAQLTPMVPGLVAAAMVTVAAVVGIYLLCRRSWVKDRRFRVLGLFFGLKGRERLRLACCWLKLVLVCSFLLFFQRLDALEYAMVVLCGILGIALDQGVGKRVEGVFWLALQIAGLFSANLVCRFVQELAGGWLFTLIYIAMGLFLALFSVYLFLNELVSISAQRMVDAKAVWSRDN